MDLTEPNFKNCQFCKNIASYTCPKCYQPYCSSICYKSEKHRRCTEDFYKDQVFETLKSQTISGEEKQKMLNIIKKVENKEEENQVLYEEVLEEKIEKEQLNFDQDLDLETLWTCLTKEGKQNFSNLVKSGILYSIVDVWKPWWTIERNNKLVQELGENEVEVNKYPAICTDIVPFRKLVKNPPSDILKYNLINILYSYAFIARYFNGAHFELIEEAYEIFLYTSTVFKGKRNFNSAEEAVKIPIQLLEESEWKISSEQAISVILDVILIIKDHSSQLPINHILSALSDLKQMLKSAKKLFNKQDKLAAKDCTLYIKKLDFYLSLSLDFGKDLDRSVNSLQLEYMSSIKEPLPKEKPQVKLISTKPLIEFID